MGRSFHPQHQSSRCKRLCVCFNWTEVAEEGRTAWWGSMQSQVPPWKWGQDFGCWGLHELAFPKPLGSMNFYLKSQPGLKVGFVPGWKCYFKKKKKKKTEFPFAFLLLWRKEKNIVNKKFCYIIHFSLYILFVFVYACTFVCAHVPWDWSYRMMWATV